MGSVPRLLIDGVPFVKVLFNTSIRAAGIDCKLGEGAILANAVERLNPPPPIEMSPNNVSALVEHRYGDAVLPTRQRFIASAQLGPRICSRKRA